jgi:hypothetical protein
MMNLRRLTGRFFKQSLGPFRESGRALDIGARRQRIMASCDNVLFGCATKDDPQLRDVDRDPPRLVCRQLG